MTARVLRPGLFPTVNIAGLLFILAAMWYAGASQGNGAAYVLLFLLASVVIVSVPRTIANLKALKVSAESAKPVFAGQEVSMPVELQNLSRSTHHSISVTLPDGTGFTDMVPEIAEGKAARTALRFPAMKRGEHIVTQLALESVYPLGFVKSRRLEPVNQRYLVYPKPAGDPAFPHPVAKASEQVDRLVQMEGDDFSGVRAYIPGESQRHIDWKAVARGLPMMTKQFVVESGGVLFLDFDAIRYPDVESRLSQLTLWVVEAERGRLRYGLRLPSLEIAPSLGEEHYHKCLRALALFR